MILLSLFLLFLSVCAYSIFYWVMQFDLTLPEVDLVAYVRGKTKKKGQLHFMTIFPHPDDETMMSGGTIAKYSRDPRVRVTVVSMTRGEHGDELLRGITPKELANIRKKELHRACEIMGVSQLIFAPFEDGKLKKTAKYVEQFVSQLYIDEKPDLVITFEQAGIYGHPDHVLLSAVIKKVQKKYAKIPVLYATLPQKILKRIHLPLHMAEQPASLKQAVPELRVSFPGVSWKKYLATLCHRSQNLNDNGKSPLWITSLLHPVEYYSEQ